MLNKYENCSLTIESTCGSRFKCGAEYWFNKLEHCGKGQKLITSTTPKCCGKCHCVVKGKFNVSFV